MARSCVNLTKRQFYKLCESEFVGYLERTYNDASEIVVYKLEKPSLILTGISDIKLVDEWKQLVLNYEVVRHYLNDSGYNPLSSGDYSRSLNVTTFGNHNLDSGLYLDPRLTPERKAFYESKAHNLMMVWVEKMCEEVKEAIREKFSDMPRLEEILDTLTFGFKNRK